MFLRLGEFPEASGKFPEASGKFPEASGEFPEVSGKFLEASGKFPEASGKFPEASAGFLPASGTCGGPLGPCKEVPWRDGPRRTLNFEAAAMVQAPRGSVSVHHVNI